MGSEFRGTSNRRYSKWQGISIEERRRWRIRERSRGE